MEPAIKKEDIKTIPFSDFPSFIREKALEKETNVFCIIDGASDEKIFPMLKSSDWDYACLYRKGVHYEGERMTDAFAATAPYLITLDPRKLTVEKFSMDRIGKHQVIFLESGASKEEVAKHCSSMLKAMDEDGKVFGFRYYDPRVLRVYLPTCTAEELFIFFGEIDTIWVEGEGKDMLEFVREIEASEEEKVEEEPKEEDLVKATPEGYGMFSEVNKDVGEEQKEEGYGIAGDFRGND